MMNITVSTTGRTVVEFTTGTLTVYHCNEQVRELVLGSLGFWLERSGEGTIAQWAESCTASALKASAIWGAL